MTTPKMHYSYSFTSQILAKILDNLKYARAKKKILQYDKKKIFIDLYKTT